MSVSQKLRLSITRNFWDKKARATSVGLRKPRKRRAQLGQCLYYQKIMSYRNWCFTWNNYEEHCDDAEQFLHERFECSYCIYGKETGEEEDTPHLQGYMEFNKQQRFNKLHKIEKTIHWERRKGSQGQAITYASKDGDLTEWGKLKRQGSRADLDRFREIAITDGMRAVATDGNCQQIRVAEKYLTYCEEPRRTKPLVYWIYGPTGVGKTRKAYSDSDEDDYYVKTSPDKWWDGYDAHETVIIDDFRDSWWDITEMLHVLDRYEHRVQYKGGFRQLRATKIIITSVDHPNDMMNYQAKGEDLKQLIRRIDVIEFIGEESPMNELINSIDESSSIN